MNDEELIKETEEVAAMLSKWDYVRRLAAVVVSRDTSKNTDETAWHRYRDGDPTMGSDIGRGAQAKAAFMSGRRSVRVPSTDTKSPKVVKTHWLQGSRNDGEYEYTESGDCDGSHIAYFRRRPEQTIDSTTWEKVDAIPENARWWDGREYLPADTNKEQQ